MTRSAAGAVMPRISDPKVHAGLRNFLEAKGRRGF